MNKYSLSALVAAGLLAGGMSIGSASAADLGGDCCADLEERVAELEATTARKGNRKVSLTITGFVNEQVMYWDDGVEQNVYQIGGGSTGLASNVKFSGSAQITPGWSAGYLLHMELETANSLFVNQSTDDVGALQHGKSGGFSDVNVMQSYWFLKSDQLGKLSVGQLSQATDNTALLVDGSGSLVQANWVLYEANGFAIRTAAGGASGLVWGTAASCRGMGGTGGDCNGVPSNGVRYDTPTFGGFSMSASWGEDDFWGVAARWAGEAGGFKLAAAVGYNETSEHFGTLAAVQANTLDYLQAGVYVQHVPTGLFVVYNFGLLDEETDTDGGAAGVRIAPPESTTHWVKAGIRTKLSALGHTVFYGEYMNVDDGSDFIGAGTATTSEMERYGAGIVQEIDAAAMSLYIKYRHHEYEDDSGVNFQDFDYVSGGALIAF